MEKCFQGEWALVLGSSSGMGLASAKALAEHGMNILGVHFDRRSAMKQVEEDIAWMKDQGVEVEFFNQNAADEEKRRATVETIKERIGGKTLRTMLHSLAFGTLKRFIDENEDGELTQKQMEMTLDVMANSLVYWTQDLRRAGLIGKGSRIFALTSAGSHTAWPNYGAVSAAKAALESHVRQITFEGAKEGISANAIQAGVVVTPALKKIPGNEKLISEALARNPSGRMTTVEDVAKVVCLMSRPEADWVRGSVIFCDGGEDIVG
ncbi:SDR family oxidoreductase [bacterium]|nr:SDR family oxidoreductase [bacterium]